MRLDEMRRALVTYLVWMAFLSLGLILAMTESIPLRLAVLQAKNMNILLVQCEIFFLLLVWPLFVPAMVGHVAGRRDRCLSLLGHSLVLLLLSFPLSLVTNFVARNNVETLLAGRLMGVAASVFVAGVFGLGGGSERLTRWYFFALLLLTGALPYASFVTTGTPTASTLSWFSPMWSAAQLNATPAMPLATAAIFGGAGAVLVALSWMVRPRPALNALS